MDNFLSHLSRVPINEAPINASHCSCCFRTETNADGDEISKDGLQNKKKEFKSKIMEVQFY